MGLRRRSWAVVLAQGKPLDEAGSLGLEVHEQTAVDHQRRMTDGALKFDERRCLPGGPTPQPTGFIPDVHCTVDHRGWIPPTEACLCRVQQRAVAWATQLDAVSRGDEQALVNHDGGRGQPPTLDRRVGLPQRETCVRRTRFKQAARPCNDDLFGPRTTGRGPCGHQHHIGHVGLHGRFAFDDPLHRSTLGVGANHRR